MRKLISAGLFRLRKEKTYRIALVFMSLGSIVFSIFSYISARNNPNLKFCVEDMTFNLLPVMGFIFVIFIGMRIGTEYDEHTMRNKFIVGHSRTQIFFAEYLTCLIASLILYATMIVFSTVSGYLIFRDTYFTPSKLAYLIFCCIFTAAVFSAIGVGISMNIRSKAVSLVVSIILLFVLMLTASACISALAEEPMTYSYIRMSTDGGMEYGDLIENPAYVEGTRRIVYQLIADILPTGQTIQLNNMECENAGRWPWLSVIMLIIVTFAGYIPFRKKDIK